MKATYHISATGITPRKLQIRKRRQFHLKLQNVHWVSHSEQLATKVTRWSLSCMYCTFPTFTTHAFWTIYILPTGFAELLDSYRCVFLWWDSSRYMLLPEAQKCILYCKGPDDTSFLWSVRNTTDFQSDPVPSKTKGGISITDTFDKTLMYWKNGIHWTSMFFEASSRDPPPSLLVIFIFFF